jgi:signal transduction histidine kinase
MAMSTSRILIVDDDRALLQALPQTLYLRIQDITVDTCDSAQGAIQLVEEHDYDAIVSDVKMPGMDGLELLAHIRDLRPDTPTLLITGHGEHNTAIQALRGGAYDYILKPIEREAFIAALQRAVQTRRLRRQVVEQHLALSQHAKSLEQLVERRTRELVDANATKDKFLGIVAHEIEPPLAALLGMAQMLHQQVEAGSSADVIKQGVVDLEHSITRTSALVRNLLDTSLMDTNMFVLRRERCDLVEVCHRLLDEYTTGSGPMLISELRGQPLEAEVDRDRLSQVLLNLLSSTHKYASKDSPVTVTLQQVGYEAVISVAAGDANITPGAQSHEFDKPYHDPQIEAYNGSQPGNGLGLYITRKIVERHGGYVDVQDTPEHGNIFSVRLPLIVDFEKEPVDTHILLPHTQAMWTIVY